MGRLGSGWQWPFFGGSRSGRVLDGIDQIVDLEGKVQANGRATRLGATHHGAIRKTHEADHWACRVARRASTSGHWGSRTGTSQIVSARSARADAPELARSNSLPSRSSIVPARYPAFAANVHQRSTEIFISTGYFDGKGRSVCSRRSSAASVEIPGDSSGQDVHSSTFRNHVIDEAKHMRSISS